MRRFLVGLFIIGALFCGVWFPYKAMPWSRADMLSLGTFIVLTLTLVVLICYASSTHLVASITRLHWERENILQASYSMEILPQDQFPDGRTMFHIGNPSSLVLFAKVWCNFQLYNQPVEYHDDFNGKKTWYIFPQQKNWGYFELAPLLAKKGKTIGQVTSEANDNNRQEQLTMNLRIEFRDELGNQRKLPSRLHHFDFKAWQWIPTFTYEDDWTER